MRVRAQRATIETHMADADQLKKLSQRIYSVRRQYEHVKHTVGGADSR